jgi:tRNA(adenine34) deaminase
MMARCIELSSIAVAEGEYPFGAVIALDGHVVAEATNRTFRDGDITRHAEVIALSIAQKTVGRAELFRATLYSNVEPCAMCSYCIREAWIGRVVYSLNSPIMGGLSKWNILRDDNIADRVPIFGPSPEVVSGVMLNEVRQAWRSWNPLAWELIELRGVLSAPHVQSDEVKELPAHRWSPWHYLILLLRRLMEKRRGVSGIVKP